MAYAIITAAYNEASYLAKTIDAVTSQTVLPAFWVIVSDGSTDRTDDIVREGARNFPFIQLLRIDKKPGRDFASKVYALNEGAAKLKDGVFEFIAHLDADISFGPSYFASLLQKFADNPRLGIAGGTISEWDGRAYRPRPSNSERSVPGAIQMFRRECYDSLGGFRPLRYGGEDWCAEVMARMAGWEVQSFPDLEAQHHRSTGSADGVLRRAYRSGITDFAIGSHPVFEMAKVARRFWTPPRVTGALARLCGFVMAYVRREKRVVTHDFVAFLRMDEMNRLGQFARRGLRRLTSAQR